MKLRASFTLCTWYLKCKLHQLHRRRAAHENNGPWRWCLIVSIGRQIWYLRSPQSIRRRRDVYQLRRATCQRVTKCSAQLFEMGWAKFCRAYAIPEVGQQFSENSCPSNVFFNFHSILSRVATRAHHYDIKVPAESQAWGEIESSPHIAAWGLTRFHLPIYQKDLWNWTASTQEVKGTW